MSKSKKIKCILSVAAVVSAGWGTCSRAQNDGLGNTQPDGGLRGPQDIINSANARDAYGNARPPADGGYNPSGQMPLTPYNAPPSAPEPGSIRPFTQGPAGYAPSAGGYPGAPAGYSGAPSGYSPGAGRYQAPGGYPQSPPYADANGGYQGQGYGQVPSYKYSSKNHHHHHHQNQSAQNPSARNPYPQDLSAGGYAGGSPAPNMSGPPGATYPYSTGGGAGGGGNSSLAGAAVGVPDRAGKTAVGVGGKAAKEVLKALF